ncbi:uncharacterized protein V6R79_011707 [Siganus canaliculatus]
MGGLTANVPDRHRWDSHELNSKETSSVGGFEAGSRPRRQPTNTSSSSTTVQHHKTQRSKKNGTTWRTNCITLPCWSGRTWRATYITLLCWNYATWRATCNMACHLQHDVPSTTWRAI